MEMLKKFSNWIFVGLVVLLMITSMKSCSRGRMSERLAKDVIALEAEKDSLGRALNDSIVNLNYQISVLKVEKEGLEKSLELQSAAVQRIAESKKNVNVVLRDQRKKDE